MIKGRNCWISANDKVKRLGFFTFRVVSAESFANAGIAALQLVRDEEWFRNNLKNAVFDPPVIEIDKTTEVQPGDGPGPGFIWFPDDAD